MALTLKDRVLETASAPGTGSVSLLGAVTGYQSFSSAIGNANTCYYTIADQSGANWEVGIGTYSSSGNTLARTTVLSSSNGGSLTNFASGTQNVFVTYPAEEAVYSNGTNIVGPSGIPLAVSSGGTGLTTLTSGYIPYGNGTSAFSSNANLTFNGTTLSTNTLNAVTFNINNGNNGTLSGQSYYAGFNQPIAELDFYNSASSLSNKNIAYIQGWIGSNNNVGVITFNAANGSNATEIARFTGAGYLGIGTSSPTAQLTTTLDASISGLTVGKGGGAVSTNTAVGNGALSNSSNTGDKNTALGNNALNANTTGYLQTAIGFGALYVNTTGNSNIAVGGQSLFANTTGSNNVSVGVYSLEANTSGASNTAMGSGALFSNTTASNNTAVGYQAGYNVSTGANNAFFGYQAGYSNTAANNTAVGYQTLYNNTSGTPNTAFGALALYANTTGASNNAFGLYALSTNTTGGSNVAIGDYALRLNTTASYNTAVGYQAGYNNNANNNTAVGYQAGYSNTTGDITAFGYQAGFANTTGIQNTAFGNTALKNNTTGNGNAAFGEQTLYANTTGGSNSAFGNFAAQNITTGNYNIAVGRESLYNNTTASNNTAVGYQAGYNTTTGTGRNTLIGYYSGYSLTTGNDNTFVGVGAGNNMTTGSKNTIIGEYSGNNGGLDIRTASNYIVLSDGDGNPRGFFNDNGLLSVPNQVGFEAGIASTSDATFNSGSYIPFNTVNYQRGTSFSTSNYYFTAPVAGYYLFTVGLYFTNSASSNSNMQAGFVKNGSFISTSGGDAQGCISITPNSAGGAVELATSLVISLAAGDTVGVQPRTSSIRVYQGHCYFSGYFLG